VLAKAAGANPIWDPNATTAATASERARLSIDRCRAMIKSVYRGTPDVKAYGPRYVQM